MKLIGTATLVTVLVLAQNPELKVGDYAKNWDELCSNYADVFPTECEVSNPNYFNIFVCPVI